MPLKFGMIAIHQPYNPGVAGNKLRKTSLDFGEWSEKGCFQKRFGYKRNDFIMKKGIFKLIVLSPI